MSECYKCGRRLAADQVECDPPCFGNPPEEDCLFTPDQIREQIRDYEKNTVPIDWDKVQTVDDLKVIFRNMMYDDRIHKESPAYKQLKRFLKE